MKKSIQIIVAGIFLIGTTLTSCTSQKEDVEEIKENLNATEQEIDSVNQDYISEMVNFRKITTETIARNDQKIIDFNKRIESEKNDIRIKYEKKIADLTQKNTDLRKRMEDYDAPGNESWELFRNEFNSDMHDLVESMERLFGKDEVKSEK